MTLHKFTLIIESPEDETSGDLESASFREFISRAIIEGMESGEIEGVGCFSIIHESTVTE